ncbi:MAG: methyltransferase domain-containing protein [Vicinamibacteraceae bacterium]|nr:methyltransferase domain-containing protein [Vicinamibacteraceae bacterium]
MSQPSYAETRRAWVRIWDEADLAAEHATAEYARSRAIRDRYLAFVPPGARILEAGCGVGTEMLALARRGHRAIGIDYVVPALGLLHRHDRTLRLAAADVHALPFRTGAVDAYLSFGVLEHFEHGMGPALVEAARVVAPGGTIVVTVPAPNVVWRLVRRRRRSGAPEAATTRSYYETAYDAGTLTRAVGDAGFDVVLVEPVGHAFTLWGLGGPFRARGHYRTSALADALGRLAAVAAPHALAFATLVVGTRRRGGVE